MSVCAYKQLSSLVSAHGHILSYRRIYSIYTVPYATQADGEPESLFSSAPHGYIVNEFSAQNVRAFIYLQCGFVCVHFVRSLLFFGRVQSRVNPDREGAGLCRGRAFARGAHAPRYTFSAVEVCLVRGKKCLSPPPLCLHRRLAFRPRFWHVMICYRRQIDILSRIPQRETFAARKLTHAHRAHLNTAPKQAPKYACAECTHTHRPINMRLGDEVMGSFSVGNCFKSRRRRVRVCRLDIKTPFPVRTRIKDAR